MKWDISPFPVHTTKRKKSCSMKIGAHRPKYNTSKERKYFKRKTETGQHVSSEEELLKQ